MAKFRKKPVVIEAVLNNSDLRPADLFDLVSDAKGVRVDGRAVIIQTLEGELRAEEGDWIIRGIKGEIYPCKPDIFRATYEPVEEQA